ncbi:hypothetical protein [Endozoicomonas sp.]|uniref:hypothetical protein n=1 Tax=Endozoicomonas sp. TaxID=1892382 RepID=UPI003AF6401C
MKKLSLLLPIAAIPVLVFADNKQMTTVTYLDRGNLQLVATEEPSSFARQITENTPNQDRRHTLENYINSLLKANAIYNHKEGKENPRLIYQIHANNEGTIIATRSEQGKYGVQIGNRSLPVYGINYDLQSDCSWQEQLCWVFYPSSNHQKERWLEISYAPHAIAELKEGVSLLIRNLQK